MSRKGRAIDAVVERIYRAERELLASSTAEDLGLHIRHVATERQRRLEHLDASFKDGTYRNGRSSPPFYRPTHGWASILTGNVSVNCRPYNKFCEWALLEKAEIPVKIVGRKTDMYGNKSDTYVFVQLMDEAEEKVWRREKLLPKKMAKLLSEHQALADVPSAAERRHFLEHEMVRIDAELEALG